MNGGGMNERRQELGEQAEASKEREEPRERPEDRTEPPAAPKRDEVEAHPPGEMTPS